MSTLNRAGGKLNIRWALVAYDAVIFCLAYLYIFIVYHDLNATDEYNNLILAGIYFLALFIARVATGIYRMIIRYGGVQCYLRLFLSDLLGLAIFYAANLLLPLPEMTLRRATMLCALNLLGVLLIRLVYRYCFRNATKLNKKGALLRTILAVFGGTAVIKEKDEGVRKINIAIMGAGRLGTLLADELLGNDSASYLPVCFIDGDKQKQGRVIMGLPVIEEGSTGVPALKDLGVQEVVFAITDLTPEKGDFLFKFYRGAGYRIKVYDFPMQDVNKQGKARIMLYRI